MTSKFFTRLPYFLLAGMLAVAVFGSPQVFALERLSGTIRKSVTPMESRRLMGARLGEEKLRLCMARENTLKQRLTKLTEFATNMLSKFDSIAARVETYYTEKVLPSGKIVPNYQTLLDDMHLKKTTVQTGLDKAKANSTLFNCDTNDPRGLLDDFHENMRSVKDALNQYRTSIRNLIVAVHSVTGDLKRSQTDQGRPTGTESE